MSDEKTSVYEFVRGLRIDHKTRMRLMELIYEEKRAAIDREVRQCLGPKFFDRMRETIHHVVKVARCETLRDVAYELDEHMIERRDSAEFAAREARNDLALFENVPHVIVCSAAVATHDAFVTLREAESLAVGDPLRPAPFAAAIKRARENAP